MRFRLNMFSALLAPVAMMIASSACQAAFMINIGGNSVTTTGASLDLNAITLKFLDNSDDANILPGNVKLIIDGNSLTATTQWKKLDKLYLNVQNGATVTGVTWESGPKLSTSSPNFVFGNNAQNFNPPNYFDLVLDFIPTHPSSTNFHWYDTSVFTLPSEP